MATGEQDAQWGVKLNTDLELLESSISGRAAVTHDDTANYTLTTASGSDDEARHMILNIGGALGAARNVVVPTKSKLYVVKNATTGGFAVTVKTSAGTGISVPNNKTMILFCDGTNVVEAITSIVSSSLTSPDITTSITTSSTTFNAFAGATTLLTLGGTGATSVVAIPGTKASTSSTTGSATFAGGIGVAGNSFFGSALGVTGQCTVTGGLVGYSGLSIDAQANLGAAIATTATSGHVSIASCVGPPTGVPTPTTGTIAFIFDSSNQYLYAYLNGGWKKTTQFT